MFANRQQIRAYFSRKNYALFSLANLVVLYSLVFWLNIINIVEPTHFICLDLKDATSLAQLEPLSEAYEDEINESVYDGLNMKIINADPSQNGPTLEVPTCTTSSSSSSSSSNSKPGKH